MKPAADVAGRRMFALQLGKPGAELLAEPVGAFQQSVLLEGVEHRERGGAGQRIAAIGGTESAG